MTDNNQPPTLVELRQMVSQNAFIDEQTFRRMLLASMAEIYERIAELDGHTHPEIDEKLKSLEARDVRVIITTVITGLVAGVLAYFAPHK